MYIKNLGLRPFDITTPRQLITDLKGRRVINFEKRDQCRPRTTNLEILKLFDSFINSPGIEEILLWYKSQTPLFYFYKDSNTKRLKFWGCSKYADHHGSNIEYYIKHVLHQMLHDNGSKKLLIDRHSMALVAFGILPLYGNEESGNSYQGFTQTKTINVLHYEVQLSPTQINSAREILRLIKRSS